MATQEVRYLSKTSRKCCKDREELEAVCVTLSLPCSVMGALLPLAVAQQSLKHPELVFGLYGWQQKWRGQVKGGELRVLGRQKFHGESGSEL